MSLTYGDIKHLFIKTLGYQHDELAFFIVTTDENDLQLKGLFVPLENGAEKLTDAISNGAVAAVWDINEQLPFYKPNDFPVLFTDDINRCFFDMMEIYVNKLKDVGNEKMTYFQTNNKNLLFQIKEIKDSHTILKNYEQLIESINDKKRG